MRRSAERRGTSLAANAATWKISHPREPTETGPPRDARWERPSAARSDHGEVIVVDGGDGVAVSDHLREKPAHLAGTSGRPPDEEGSGVPLTRSGEERAGKSGVPTTSASWCALLPQGHGRAEARRAGAAAL